MLPDAKYKTLCDTAYLNYICKLYRRNRFTKKYNYLAVEISSHDEETEL